MVVKKRANCTHPLSLFECTRRNQKTPQNVRMTARPFCDLLFTSFINISPSATWKKRAPFPCSYDSKLFLFRNNRSLRAPSYRNKEDSPWQFTHFTPQSRRAAHPGIGKKRRRGGFWESNEGALCAYFINLSQLLFISFPGQTRSFPPTSGWCMQLRRGSVNKYISLPPAKKTAAVWKTAWG